jgi:diguanylate cyclase (GGDEF)-like protein
MALTLLTGILGAYAQRSERELGALATRIYDEAFMGVSYLRSAQVGFAVLTNSARQGSLETDDIAAVLDDLSVARDRAMSPKGEAAAESLRDAIAAAAKRRSPAFIPADVARIQAEFERAVETFAGDGFHYRRGIGPLVAAQVQQTAIVIGITVLIALSMTFLLTQLIARPVIRAVGIAQSIAAGRLDNTIIVKGDDETAELLRALSIMQSSIAEALDRIRALMAQQATDHASEMAAEHARLEAALDNMNQGLCLFDANGCLAIANHRFADMFGEPQPNAPAETVLRDAGLDMLLESAGNGSVTALSCELPDGRLIAVSQQTVASGGWVATYEDISERRATEIRLAHMARHDALTGLPNRLLLSEHTMGLTRRGDGVVVLCLNLDRFKAVNDVLGHAVGDALLCAVTERLRQCVRKTDLVVRLGGDEFAIVQDTANQPQEATSLARRLVDLVARPFEIDNHEIVIGVSIGISLANDRTETAEASLKRADLAMHWAKTGGRGTFRFFESEMDAAMQARRMLELDLRKALAEEQLELYYQPLVRIEGVAGFEALMRWHHPIRGMVSPAEFIPVAEEIGLIGSIGAWALMRACMDAATWPGRLKVAVNLSPVQFRTRALEQDAARALASSGLSASRLELEITESVLIQDEASVLDTLHALRTMGIRIAMDDFGTGYSSLSYLRRFPFDKIKIDQSFIRGMADQDDCRTIVRAVIGLGRSLGIAVNAEGVETPEQLAALRAEGCSEIQGFLFSKPRPANEIPELVRRLGNATIPGNSTPSNLVRIEQDTQRRLILAPQGDAANPDG